MTQLPSPAPLVTSSTTKTFFTASGVSVLWDETKAQLVQLYPEDPSRVVFVKNLFQLSFNGEEIEDIATFGDEIFILTRIPTATHWKRPWKRRPSEAIVSDPYYDDETPLCAYLARLFSVDDGLQLGETLRIRQEGVEGHICAGPHRIIVRIIGQECVAGIWLSPTSERNDWQLVHSELTWDPDSIAKQMGFENAQEELMSLPWTNAESESEDISDEESESDDIREDDSDDESDSEPKDIREDFADEETLDYVFLSDDLVGRLRESAEYQNDLELWLEIFKISTQSATPPILLKLPLPAGGRPVELSNSYLTSEPRFSEKRCLSVCLNNSGRAGLIILDANKIRQFALNSPSNSPTTREVFNQVCCQEFEDDAPFVANMAQYLAPSTSHPVFLFPTVDLSPNTAHPKALMIRFGVLPAPDLGRPNLATIDIPVTSLIPADDLISEDLIKDFPYLMDAPFALSWDGDRTACVVFRSTQRLPAIQEPNPRVWYITLSPDILASIGRNN